MLLSTALTLAALAAFSPKIKLPPGNLPFYIFMGGVFGGGTMCNLAVFVKSAKLCNLAFFLGMGITCSAMGFCGWLFLHQKNMSFMGAAWIFVAVLDLAIMLAMALGGRTNAQLAKIIFSRKDSMPK